MVLFRLFQRFNSFVKEPDDVDREKKTAPETNGPAHVEIPINISEEMTKSSLWKSFARERKDSTGSKRNGDRHHSSSRGKHRHKHKHKHKHRDKDNDQGLWFASDKKQQYFDDENDSCELRRLTAIEEDPIVDPKESIDLPEVIISMPSSNGIESSKNKSE